MLDCIYHRTLKLHKNHFLHDQVNILPLLCQVKMDVITECYYICKQQVVYQFYCMMLHHSEM